MGSSIKIKTADEIGRLRIAGRILAGIVQTLQGSLKSGVTTKDIDETVESLIAARGVRPAFKGYRGFPGCACVSVNEEVVHGIPSKDRVVKNGDILSIDIGIIYQDYYADTAFSVGIGDVSPDLRNLLDVTRQALGKGIEQARTGHHVSDISHAVQTFVEGRNLSIVRDFVGHGIGHELHEDPEIPNFGPPHRGPELKEGMVLAIEPMVNAGTWRTNVKDDGWTVVTADKKPSAHFEHTILITHNGPEILTQHG
jgi:methionyl aminopeptidase